MADTTPDSPIDPKVANRVLLQIIANTWLWDLREFARRLDKSPDDVWVREKFKLFREVGDNLRLLLGGPDASPIYTAIIAGGRKDAG